MAVSYKKQSSSSFIQPFQGWGIKYTTDREIQVPDNWPALGQGIIHNNQSEWLQTQCISTELQCTQPPSKFLPLWLLMIPYHSDCFRLHWSILSKKALKLMVAYQHLSQTPKHTIQASAQVKLLWVGVQHCASSLPVVSYISKQHARAELHSVDNIKKNNRSYEYKLQSCLNISPCSRCTSRCDSASEYLR